MSEKKKEVRCRSWFCVLNNPSEHYPELKEKKPEEICKLLSEKWCVSDSRSGGWVYCISADGLHHVHMVLEDDNKSSFTAVKTAYDKAHIEPTQGNKKQVEDYIYKRGAFEEKGEQILCTHLIGEIKGKQGQRSDLAEVKNLIDSGLTPRKVLAMNPNYYRISGYIERMYYEKKLADTPCIREVTVYWHFGATKTGKTYQAYKDMEEKGREHVFVTSAENPHAFDNYQAQNEVWIDELRQDSPFFRFATLLQVCDKYTADIQCRYSDKLMLWNELHITSPMLPYEIYDNLARSDKINQLYRRIDYYVYHYKDKTGNYKSYVYNDCGCEQKVERDYIRYLAGKRDEQHERMEQMIKNVREISDKKNIGVSLNTPKK